ncbi:MAG: HK97 family phage prohead protease, partial [Candidatus Rokuibacteriota bacterium]
MILPWGKVASSGGATYRFMRGSVELPGDVSRIKLIRDHDPRAAVGKATEFTDRDDGLWADFYIKRGAAGDEVLSDAEDGVLDGFSVGPKIDSDGWQYESGGSDVRVVSKARLIETTITAFPAFDDARVATVIAERSGAKMGAEDG